MPNHLISAFILPVIILFLVIVVIAILVSFVEQIIWYGMGITPEQHYRIKNNTFYQETAKLLKYNN